jgi:hypothetical protein
MSERNADRGAINPQNNIGYYALANSSTHDPKSANTDGLPANVHHLGQTGSQSIAAPRAYRPRLIHPSEFRHHLHPRDEADWSHLPPVPDQYLYADKFRAELFGIVNSKIGETPGEHHLTCWAKCAKYSSYAEQAAVLINSRYFDRESFARCGQALFWEPKGPDDGYWRRYSCGRKWFCPRCCKKRAEKYSAKFESAFVSGCEVYYLVTSTSRNADYRQRFKFIDGGMRPLLKRLADCVDHHIPVTEENIAICAKLLREYQDAIGDHSRLYKNRLFEGSIIVPEFAVKLLPLSVVPHLNIIAFTQPGFSSEHLAMLLRDLALRLHNNTELRRWRSKLGGLYPAVYASRLLSGDNLRGVLRYISKPIALGDAYREARRFADGRHAKVALNDEVNSFLLSLPKGFDKIKVVTTYGICDPRARNYVGKKEATTLKSKNKKVNKRKRKKRSPRPMLDEPNHEGQPVGSHWAQFRLFAPYTFPEPKIASPLSYGSPIAKKGGP